ncbi:Protein of unknown function DUF4464 [Carpediemonas membranifera]|uniref:Cilia- and flagella-associated protein 299 n=1 Tax=Carpediemonas membranifera TaxID=201153 RepID=A0A8J6AX09_9EUKA|nr:Protein of unknown function DUF4464 [Carpediemonas membranifera]|eukprot:KAG9396268.1 Protein of unknown function DUF4464 [Carpediemonas membranifera]
MGDNVQFDYGENNIDTIALAFNTYDEYLDSQITTTDMFYLDDQDMARQLVELGYRGNGDTLKREEFEARKAEAENARLSKLTQPERLLAHEGKDLENFPFLQALAKREEMVCNGKLAVVIFIRDKNHKGQEISGYIDYAHRLRTDRFDMYFDRKKKLLPRPSDLSFYNWETLNVSSNSSPNFEVVADNEEGLLLKNKRDRKVINVNPKVNPGDNTRRHTIETQEYTQCVIFDHITRRKA